MKVVISFLFLISCCVFLRCVKNPQTPDTPFVKLTVSAIHPIQGKVQLNDTINGTGFSNDRNADSVYFNGALATVISASPSQLIVQIPILATSGNVSVSVNGIIAPGPFFTVSETPLALPVITALSPIHGAANSVDTIFGSGFSEIPGNNNVFFNNVSASVIAATVTKLIVTVPASNTGNISIEVNGNYANGPVYTYDEPQSDSVIIPKSHSDTLAFITHNWMAFQDTISSINYGNSFGAPISGVIYNPPNDYWNFMSNGNIAIVLEGSHYSTTYQLMADNQLLINGLPAGLNKPCSITTLNSKTFIFTTTDTSSNGGTYYRRIWVKR